MTKLRFDLQIIMVYIIEKPKFTFYLNVHDETTEKCTLIFTYIFAPN